MAAVAVTLLVLAVVITGYVWHDRRSKQQQQQQQQQRDAVLGGGEVLEMIENPLRRGPGFGAAAAAAAETNAADNLEPVAMDLPSAVIVNTSFSGGGVDLDRIGNTSSSTAGSNGDDVPYGGVTYVAGPNQDAPEYATAVEAGGTDASYSVVALKNRGGNGDDEENHCDMSAPGAKSRGKKAKQKQQRQQQQAPAMVYDVAQHAGGGGGGGGGGAAAAQSAEYSHLAPRNDGGGAESNNFYDLGPQQRGQQHGAAAAGGERLPSHADYSGYGTTAAAAAGGSAGANSSEIVYSTYAGAGAGDGDGASSSTPVYAVPADDSVAGGGSASGSSQYYDADPVPEVQDSTNTLC